MIDEAKLHQFVGQMLSDLGGAASVALVRIGDALGLYKTHARARSDDGRRDWPRRLASTSAICANGCRIRPPRIMSPMIRQRKNSHCRQSRRWCSPSRTARFSCPAPLSCMAAMLDNQPKVEPAFKTGAGVAWGDQASCLFCAVARFFRPGYHNNLVQQLAAGARRRRRQAGARRQGRRCRLRPRLVDRDDGQGVPELAVHRLRLSPRFDRARARPTPASMGRRKHAVRGRDGQGLSRAGFRSRHVLRLPARHGRPRGGGGACPPDR